MEIYVQISLIFVLFLFLVFSFKKQLLKPQTRSRIEYLIHTNNILVLILYSKIEKCSRTSDF